jgi:hypothetical protein
MGPRAAARDIRAWKGQPPAVLRPIGLRAHSIAQEANKARRDDQP